MVRIAISTVEVTSPDGTKSLWVAALPHIEAIAAVRKVISPAHIAELSIIRPQMKGFHRGELRKVDIVTDAKSPEGADRAGDVSHRHANDSRADPMRAVSSYRAYAVDSDGELVEFKEMTCRDDGEAVAKAKQLIKACDVEVWNGDRFVIRLVKRPT
jgi:hypothetical protein